MRSPAPARFPSSGPRPPDRAQSQQIKHGLRREALAAVAFNRNPGNALAIERDHGGDSSGSRSLA